MADEGTTPQNAAGAATPLLDDMRRELEAAADDLERLTAELHQRTDLVERFEALVDELLGLLRVPVVLVDEHARVTGLSRGAAELVDDPDSAVGRAASSVLPSPLSKEVMAYVHEGDGAGDGSDGQNDGDGATGSEATRDLGDGRASSRPGVVRFLPLPGRSTLVVVGV